MRKDKTPAENPEAVQGRTEESARTRKPTNGEVAGGTRDDAPGGAYNVPEDMIEEVGEEKAVRDRARDA